MAATAAFRPWPLRAWLLSTGYDWIGLGWSGRAEVRTSMVIAGVEGVEAVQQASLPLPRHRLHYRSRMRRGSTSASAA
jgi:hypothetical protein